MSDLHNENTGLERLIKCSIGRDSSVLFWLDFWIGSGPLKDDFPALFGLESDKRASVVSKMRGSSSPVRWVFSWSRSSFTSGEADELSRLLAILNSHVGPANNEAWSWTLTSRGFFSVGSLKVHLRKQRHEVSRRATDWDRNLPAKVNIFIWRLLLNKLPTRMELSRRNMLQGEAYCLLCQENNESLEHFLTSCSFSCALWQGIASWCNLPQFFCFSVEDLLKVHSSCSTHPLKNYLVGFVIKVACWACWKVRNDFLFRNKPFNPAQLVQDIKAISFLWYSNRGKKSSLTWDQWCIFNFT